MNQESILFHLKEAKHELDRTIIEVARQKSYNIGEFRVAMGHIYHHLNTAWNGKEASPERHKANAKIDFDMWRKFPENSDLFLE